MGPRTDSAAKRNGAQFGPVAAPLRDALEAAAFTEVGQQLGVLK